MHWPRRWLTWLLLWVMSAFIGLTGYSLYSLNNLYQSIAQDPGEDMVWAVHQALYQSNLLMLAQLTPDAGHRSNQALQQALLRASLRVLMSPTQSTFMQYAGVSELLLDVKELLSAKNLEHRQIQIKLHDIGQRVMRATLNKSGERRDRHKNLLHLLTICIGSTIIAGGLLCLSLFSSLQQVGRARDEAHHLLDALEREKQARLRYRDFVSLMSHQFRTPLAVIDSSAQRLARHSTLETQPRTQRIRSAVRQLNQLVNRVLQGLKLEAANQKGIQLNYQRCDWKEVVGQTLEGLSELLTMHPVRQHWGGNSNPYFWIECDRLWCEEILSNLIVNASKYSPAGTPIDLYIESREGVLRCCVCDSGPGISEECLPNIFEAFFRGSSSSNNDGGIGLGLSIAHNLAQAHNGSLTAKNRDIGGVCFSLQLPLRQTKHSA